MQPVRKPLAQCSTRVMSLLFSRFSAAGAGSHWQRLLSHPATGHLYMLSIWESTSLMPPSSSST